MNIKILAVISVVVWPYSLLGQESGIDPIGFDRSKRVQDDLFQAVNGVWLEQTPIPDDKSDYGSFTILADQSIERIRDLVQKIAARPQSPGSDAQKIADFYNSFMDEERVNELGATPLQNELERIDEIHELNQLPSHFGRLNTIGVQTPLAFFVTQDAKDSTRYLSALIQSGTTLPNRDYYLKDDEKYIGARVAMQKYVLRLFELADIPLVPADAETLVNLEKSFAMFQWTPVQLRDAQRRYNLFEVSELELLMPDYDWQAFLGALGVPDITEVNVMTPSFFEGLNVIFKTTPVAVWRNYLRFKLLDAYAPFLSQEFVDANFDLKSRELTGIPEQKPRWKRAIERTAGAGAGDFGVLGEVVGKLYVEVYFPREAKAKMELLVENLLTSFDRSIDELSWMTDATKTQAKEKLAKIDTKIGYPNRWRDYTRLEMDRHDLVGNIMRSNLVEFDRNRSKLGQPIDREEWGMTPQTVNAYYSPSKNEIVFPAAILQKPFFNFDADDAVNYGAIGAVIGHEISHAFDDQGSQYDGDGNLNNWWTDEDRRAFEVLTRQLIDQYSQYEPLEGKRVNGELTLGENIADLSGLSIAFKAYQLSLDGEASPRIADWSGEQRFFLGWSQVWRRKYRDAEMVRRLLIDPHSPSWYRANGPVTNIDAFYEAFDVKDGDALFKPAEARIRIW